MKWDCQLMSPKEKRKIGAESHYRIEEGMTEKVKRQYLTKSKETVSLGNLLHAPPAFAR